MIRFTHLILALPLFGFVSPAFAGFSYYSRLRVNHEYVHNSDLPSFPILVRVADNRFKTVASGGHVNNSNGYDIRPYSDAGLTTALSYQLERFTASTGEVFMWVKIPALSHTLDTLFYLAYGDPSLNSDGSSTSTWDSNFRGIWHLSDGSILNGSDATTYGHPLLVQGAISATTGQIDGAVHDNGTSGSYLLGADSIDYDLASAATWSAWVKTGSGNVSSILDRDLFGTAREFQFRMDGN